MLLFAITLMPVGIGEDIQFKYDAILLDTVQYCSDWDSLVSIGSVRKINILSDTRKCRFEKKPLRNRACALRAVSTGEEIRSIRCGYVLLTSVVLALIVFV